ncbi:MAG: plasmid pRiA4b ORF-3 family protein [Gordonia sp. (in: high G+C Gram-positive bacteria)]|uniref:plasmid pRiA4b ORF-3 family protein n=1 Tax=Gordonia sp. (in: high G+C Gram-positive bacteria) TaxID=84139 RepID=UPI0039E2BD81
MTAARLTLLVELEDVEPPITRTLQVDGAVSLADLHVALQIAFGWRDRHPHLFTDRERPGTGARHWGAPELRTVLDLEELRSEDDTTVSEAFASDVAGGSDDTDPHTVLRYEYDFGDGWRHRITAAAPTAAIGVHRKVALLNGTGRGPIEDSGGPRGYTDTLAALADPEHPDHAEITAWTTSVAGPWFPPTPDSFDPEAIQAELDMYFEHGADERDPYDLSGLLVADDLREPHHLASDALIVDFAASLPPAARSEFRRYARRTGLLEPAEVSPEVRERLTAPFAWLLDAVGTDGVRLSETGRLPPAVVLDGMTTLGMTTLGLHDPHWEESTREQHPAPIRRLRDAATRLGLVRVLNGHLVRTGHGACAASGPDALWEALTTRILEKLTAGGQIAATALLLTYADGRAADDPGEQDRRWRDVAFALQTCGWRLRGSTEEFGARDVADIVRPVEDVLVSLGSTRDTTGRPPSIRLDPHLADFARAVLHGSAALRSATHGRPRLRR